MKIISVFVNKHILMAHLPLSNINIIPSVKPIIIAFYKNNLQLLRNYNHFHAIDCNFVRYLIFNLKKI